MKKVRLSNKILLFTVHCLLVAVFLSGCLITKIATKEDVGTIQEGQVGLSEQILLLKDETSKIGGSLSEKDKQLRDLKEQVELFCTQFRDQLNNNSIDTNKNITSLSNNIISIQKQIDQLKTAYNNLLNIQKKDKQNFNKKIEIVLDELLGEIGKIKKQINILAPDDAKLSTEKLEDGKYYIVQKGDTLIEIAVRFGVPSRTIIQANNIEDPDFLSIGQKLIIPRYSE
ncbi:LysM peptidoglycan-binding domain-containing protein [bacterium]|nr:LysM peptidoglycan-binding domain-containing protein [bacterium]